MAIGLVVALASTYILRKPSDLTKQCVQALTSLAKSSGATVTSSGDRLWIGGREVHLRARIENEDHVDSKSLVGLLVDILVGGVLHPLTFGSVGVGNNHDDAIDAAISEWSGFVGQALLGALGVRTGDLPKGVGSFSVYPGLTGIRGEGVDWSAEKDSQLLLHLDAIIQELERSPGEFHSISLMIGVRRDGTLQGECRVDNVISPAALNAVQSLPWSANGREYIFKQFYILRRH
jgi:hypothetical protein